MTDDEAIDTALLMDAADIMQGKSDEHGSPENSFGRIASYWSVYLQIEHDCDIEIDSADVAEMMALFKLARAQSGRYQRDDYRDRLGYTNFANTFRENKDE